MQAAEMLCGTTRVYHLVFLISLAIGYVHSFPIQILPSIPGYIPVYIRHGDQPLGEINPALAEAFHEEPPLRKATVLPNVNGPTDINLEQEDGNRNKIEAIHVRQAENNKFLEDETSNVATIVDIDVEPLKLNYDPTAEQVAKLLPVTKKDKEILEKLEVELKDELKHSNRQDLKAALYNEKDKIVEVIDTMPPLHLLTSRETEYEGDTTLSDKKSVIKSLFSKALSKFRKIFGPPEALHQLEAERAENRLLEEKSK